MTKRASFTPLPKRILVRRMRPCKVLSRLLPNRDEIWRPPSRRRANRKTISLNKFSLLDYPIETMEQLHAIAHAEATVAELSIDFNDECCLDVSAYLVLGLMQQNMLPVVSGGRISKAVRSMVDAVDLGRFLQVNICERSVDDPTFVPFRLRLRRKPGTSTSTGVAFQPSSVEKLSDELIDTINIWLALVKSIQLTKTGKSYVSRMVGEVLDNAERHSDMEKQDGDWAVAGFLSFVKLKESTGAVRKTFVCSLAIASVGATIADNMAACEDDATWQDMDRYIRSHCMDRNQTRETLATVYALQDGVSRFRQDGGERSKGGVGLTDTIWFVNELGKVDKVNMGPCITLISGNACVMLREAYSAPPPDMVRRQLWFNPKNTLDNGPDPRYVKFLPYGFPGTIVAIRFSIDPKHTSDTEASS